MRCRFCLLFAVFAALGVSPARADEKSEKYLKDGRLKERIELDETQGGFAGFTGRYYVIEPDGSWSTGPIKPQSKKGEPTAKGKLTEKQLAGLAKELGRHDLAGLPSHGATRVNPKVVTIRFGDKASVLQPERGKSAPEEDQAVRARYDAIAQAVKMLCKESKE
jgi:hypothetical protein